MQGLVCFETLFCTPCTAFIGANQSGDGKAREYFTVGSIGMNNNTSYKAQGNTVPVTKIHVPR